MFFSSWSCTSMGARLRFYLLVLRLVSKPLHGDINCGKTFLFLIRCFMSFCFAKSGYFECVYFKNVARLVKMLRKPADVNTSLTFRLMEYSVKL